MGGPDRPLTPMSWIWLNLIPGGVIVLAAVTVPWILRQRHPGTLTGDPRGLRLAREAAGTWHRMPPRPAERDRLMADR